MSSDLPVGPWIRTAFFWGLCGLYFLSPIDAVPDFIPYIGRLDDVLMIFVIYRMAQRWRMAREARQRWTRPAGTAEEEVGNAEKVQKEQTAWEILQITPGATQGEIHTAYKTLLMKYHPDRVAHLGEEFQQLAHRRTVEIQQAYAQLRRS
ncbi:MAG: DUF1232 domain-containing protein [Candidatus Tectimicrobiota bacterium]